MHLKPAGSSVRLSRNVECRNSLLHESGVINIAGYAADTDELRTFSERLYMNAAIQRLSMSSIYPKNPDVLGT